MKENIWLVGAAIFKIPYQSPWDIILNTVSHALKGSSNEFSYPTSPYSSNLWLNISNPINEYVKITVNNKNPR